MNTSNFITLKQFFECIDYKITEGSDYMWHVYGSDTHQIDSWNGKHGDGAHTINVVFDKKTQTVYEMQAWDDGANRQYRWIHPDYIGAVKSEYKRRNLTFTESIDGESFIDLDLAVDILEKANAIAHGLPYDTRVQIELNLPEGELHVLMKIAHERDITLNQLVADILVEATTKVWPPKVND